MLNPCALVTSRAHTKPKIMLYNLTCESSFEDFEKCRLDAFYDNVVIDVIIYFQDKEYEHKTLDYPWLVTFMYLMNSDPNTNIIRLQVEILPF